MTIHRGNGLLTCSTVGAVGAEGTSESTGIDEARAQSCWIELDSASRLAVIDSPRALFSIIQLSNRYEALLYKTTHVLQWRSAAEERKKPRAFCGSGFKVAR